MADSSSDEEGHEPPKVATNKDAPQAQEGTKQQHEGYHGVTHMLGSAAASL